MEREAVQVIRLIVVTVTLMGLVVAVGKFVERPSTRNAGRVIRKMGPFLG